MRIVSAGMDPGDGFLDPGGSSQEFTFCFEVRFAPNKAWTPHEVPCPEADPIAFPPAPPPPASPTREQLDQILRSAGADEKAIRDALAALTPDPRVRVQVKVPGGGVAGIAVRSEDDEYKTFTCVMARLRDGEVKIWSPAPAQLQPGELTCSADEAVGGAGINPPH